MSSVYKPYQVRVIPSPIKIPRHATQDQIELPTEEHDEQATYAASVTSEMIDEAKQVAEELIAKAHREAEALKTQANEEIDAWWAERRAEDEHLTELAQNQGYEAGYEEGIKLAEAEVKQQYQDVVLQAEQLVEQAFLVKNQIISEAEPFLLELSVEIAQKIIHKQLSLDVEQQKALIQSLLQRKREKGVITLCVSPSQFMVMNASREELSRSIDAQAELQIIPDASVQDFGCVIRSALGSIDARIDTQLDEIKKALFLVLSADKEVEQ